MTTRKAAQPKPNSDDLAQMKDRLEKQADELSRQRQTIADLQKQIAAANRPLDEGDLGALEDEDDLDPIELRSKYGHARHLLNRALETIEMYREKTREQASPNKCKLHYPSGKQRRRARAVTMYGVAAQYGLIPVIDLDVEDRDQAMGVLESLQNVLGVLELMYEAVHIMDMPALPDSDDIQVEGEL